MKRILVFLLTIVMIVTTLLSVSGCTATTEVEALKMGQWLTLVADSFGMQSYTKEDPYFAKVDASDSDFVAFQMAAEWEVLEPNNYISSTTPVKWKDVLITLVNAGTFLPVDASDKEKIEWAIDNFDKTIRSYWMNRYVKIDTAVGVLGVAQNLWANKEYDHVIETVKYKENVVDLTKDNLDINEYKIENNVVVIPKKNSIDINSGDVYVLPQTDEYKFVQVNIAEEVTEDGNYYYIKNSNEDLSLEDVAQDLQIEETFSPKAENAVIYDGNGQIISVGSNVQPQGYINNNDTDVEPLGLKTGEYAEMIPVYDAQSVNQKHTFNVGDWKIKLNYKLNGELDFGVEVETPNMLSTKYKKEHPSQELTASFGAKLNSFKVTNDVDFKMFKLKSASVKVDYEQELSGKLKFAGKPVNKLVAPEYRNDGNFANNWSKKVWKDADGDNAKGSKTIKICSVDLYTVGVARICLDINFQISAEGSASITVTMRGAKGIEYKNGNIRLINTCDKDFDIDLRAKVEATLGVGPALYVVGLKKPIIGFQVAGGLGTSFSFKFNIADSQKHLIEESDKSKFSTEFTGDIQNTILEADASVIKELAEKQGGTYSAETRGKVKLHFDVCVDGCVYAIVRLSLTDSSYIAGLLGNKITTSWDIFNEKNGKIINIHADNLQWQFGYPGHPVDCMLKYVPFDGVNEDNNSEDDNQSDDTIIKGNSIVLNQINANLSIGNKHYIQLLQIPDGYEAKDIICFSSNEKIASVDKNGIVTAVSEGSTTITVSTKDKKYSAYIAIIITDPTKQEFNGLDNFDSNNI